MYFENYIKWCYFYHNPVVFAVLLPLLFLVANAPDEERALACLLNPVDGPDGRTPAHLFKARAPHPGRWAADRRPIKLF